YNTKEFYKQINKTLYELYISSTAFAENFKKPRQSNRQPSLELSKNSACQTEEAVLSTLMEIAPPKTSLQQPINIKAKLAKGELIEQVTLADNQVILIIKDPYNTKEFYKKINKTLYELYISSTAFAGNFKKPIRSNR